jgi:hypothetical protein
MFFFPRLVIKQELDWGEGLYRLIRLKEAHCAHTQMCAAQYHPSSTPVCLVTELFHGNLLSSVGNPDPAPDPYVLGLPESGSFYHKAKIVGKTSIPIVLRLLYDFLS